MKRKALLIALPALLLLFVFKLIPVFYTVMISVKQFDFPKGIYASPSAGLSMYSTLFGMDRFPEIVVNTLRLSIYSIVLTCILATVLIACISRMPRRWLKLASIALLAIPAFIPITSFVWVFNNLLAPETSIFAKVFASANTGLRLLSGDEVLYPVLFAIMDSLRNVYIPVIIGVLVCENNSRSNFRRVAFVIIGYIAARATMLLSPDIENILISSDSSVKTSIVLDLLNYSISAIKPTLQFQIDVSSAAWVIKTIAQLLVSLIACFALKVWTPSISQAVETLDKKVKGGMGSLIGIIGYLLFAAGSILIVLLTFVPTSGGLFKGLGLLLDNGIMSVFGNSLLYCVLSCILYGMMTLLLAYPLSANTKLYPVLLVVLISLSNNIIGEYVWYHQLGMVSTIYPVVINSGLSVIGAFALHFCVSGKWKQAPHGFVQYAKASLLPLLAIVSIAFITNWGSYLHQMVYVIDKSSLYGVGLVGKQLLEQHTEVNSIVQAATVNLQTAFVFLSSLVPAVLGAVLISLHKFLPLSAFTAQIRKG